MQGWAVAAILFSLLLWQFFYHHSLICRISKIIHNIAANKQSPTFIRFGSRKLREIISDLELIQENIIENERRIALEDFNLKGILSGMVEGVFVTNASGSIILANEQLLKMFQLKTSPLHKTVLEALGNHQISHALKETLHNHSRGRWEIYIRPGADPAANPLCITLNLSTIRNPNGEIFGAVAVLHDITTLKEMEVLQREFVSNTSHELRTPLAIFRGYLEELIEAPPSSKKELLRILHSLQKQTDRLQSLIQDLLTLSQFESRTITLKKQTLTLSATVEETINELRHIRELADCSITLKSRLLAGTDTVWADEIRIKQVLSNLIENAIKYSNNNGTITITIAPSSTEGMLECSVIDTGIGIPEKDLPHIFDRFYRADKGRVRSKGGTGLGLSIVKQIIEAHGGTVSISSRVNEGTTITFTLPRPANQDNAKAEPREEKLPSKTSTTSDLFPIR